LKSVAFNTTWATRFLQNNTLLLAYGANQSAAFIANETLTLCFSFYNRGRMRSLLIGDSEDEPRFVQGSL
jgi:hypothetical protein